ncbi:DUF6365 family protein [Streptomyces sp. CA2R101]|uniref:DUF6365 family protein n=1 Tax=Streptomyces sp. CA2R101 TaxID=3120152 RepID=UPI003008749D
MRLLYFAQSTATYGETFIGLSLANQLRETGAKAHFACPPSAHALVEQHGYTHTTLEESMGPDVRRHVDALVRDWRPDAIVLADYFAYWSNLEKRFRTDPWFIEDYGVPVLPIDIWELEHSSFRIDVCGGAGQDVDKHILEMPAHLRPVPLAHVDGDLGHGFPYRIIEPEQRVSEATRASIRAEFGLRDSDRLVMIPVSQWQQPPKGKHGMVSDMVHRLASGVPRLLTHYLRQLPPQTHFLVVGEPLPGFDQLPAERTHVLPRVSYERYHAVLTSSDAVLSLNMGAPTVIRSLLMDVPVVMVTNRFNTQAEETTQAADRPVGGLSPVVRAWLAEHGPIEPFRQWPKGAYHFQEPLLRDNGYAEAIVQVELLDENGLIGTLEKLLYDANEHGRHAERRARYLDAVRALPPTREVVDRALRTTRAARG